MAAIIKTGGYMQDEFGTEMRNVTPEKLDVKKIIRLVVLIALAIILLPIIINLAISVLALGLGLAFLAAGVLFILYFIHR
jgi:hypothetical protein